MSLLKVTYFSKSVTRNKLCNVQRAMQRIFLYNIQQQIKVINR